MKKFKVIKSHHNLKEGTIVLDEGISEVDSVKNGEECRAVLIEGDVVPLTYIIPSGKLEEIE